MKYQTNKNPFFCYLLFSNLVVLFLCFSLVSSASSDLSLKSRINVVKMTRFSLNVSAKTIDFGAYPKNVVEPIIQSLIITSSVNTSRSWHVSVYSSSYSSGSTQVPGLPKLWFEKVTNMQDVTIPSGTITSGYDGNADGPYNGVGLESRGQTVTFYNSTNPEDGNNIGLRMWISSGLTVNHFKGSSPLPLGTYTNSIVFTLYE